MVKLDLRSVKKLFSSVKSNCVSALAAVSGKLLSPNAFHGTLLELESCAADRLILLMVTKLPDVRKPAFMVNSFA